MLSTLQLTLTALTLIGFAYMELSWGDHTALPLAMLGCAALFMAGYVLNRAGRARLSQLCTVLPLVALPVLRLATMGTTDPEGVVPTLMWGVLGLLVAGFLLPWGLVLLATLGYVGLILALQVLAPYVEPNARYIAASLVFCMGSLIAVATATRERAQRLIGAQHTTLVQQQHELLKAHHELQALTTLREEFLTQITHELRTPLTGITATAKLLAGPGFGELAEPQASLVAVLLAHSSRMSALVQDLLDLHKLENFPMQFRMEPGDVGLLAEDLATSFRTLLHERGLDLRLDLEPVQARFDADRLAQVLSNLIDNASKYTPAGGEVRLCVKAAGQEARVCVEDTGPGIPAEHLEQVFSKFFQLGKDREGVGLGLAICRLILEGHGGRIWAESPPEGGARFVFTLPLDRSAPLTLPAPAPLTEARSHP